VTLTASLSMVSDGGWARARAEPTMAMSIFFGPVERFDPEAAGIGVHTNGLKSPRFVLLPDDERLLFLGEYWDAIHYFLTGQTFNEGWTSSDPADRTNPLYILSCYGEAAPELEPYLPDCRFTPAERIGAVSAALEQVTDEHVVRSVARAKLDRPDLYVIDYDHPAVFDGSMAAAIEIFEDMRDFVGRAKDGDLGLVLSFS
jgi:Domain of unknown function (DUF1877)